MAMRGRAKIRYGVQCNRHGLESKLWDGRMVLVSKPQNKRQRTNGCPMCNADQRQGAGPATPSPALLAPLATIPEFPGGLTRNGATQPGTAHNVGAM